MKGQDRSAFETLTVGLLVAGLVLATLLMLGIAWRMRRHDADARELETRIQDGQKVYQGMLEHLARYEQRAQKLEAGIEAEQRRITEQKELDRQAELQRQQDRQKAAQDEAAASLNAPREQMKRAESALAAGRLQEAVQRYTTVIQVEPKNALALANRGLALSQMGKFEEGLEDLRRATEADPRDAYVFQTRAAVLVDLRNPTRKENAEQALADIERAFALGGTEGYLRYTRGNALNLLERDEEAKADYRWVLEKATDNRLRGLANAVLRAMAAKEEQDKKAREAAAPKPAEPEKKPEPAPPPKPAEPEKKEEPWQPAPPPPGVKPPE